MKSIVRMILLIGLAVGASLPPPASAHTPVEGAQRRYTADYASLSFRYVGTVPTWLRTAVELAVETQWLTSNNSRAPRFHQSTSGLGSVMYDTTSECADSEPDWIGCTRRWGFPDWKVWIRSGIIGGHCENNNNATGCYRASRIMLHEAEHVTLTTSESSQGSANSNMGACPPVPPGHCKNPNSGWNSSSWKECDQAAFQLKYGLQSLSGQYADCFDHIADHGTTGLATVQTVTSSTGTTCAGMSLTRSGRISTKSTSNYGLLSNIGVAGRLIRIDRKLSSSSTWTTNWSSFTTGTNQTGNNWTRSFSETVGGIYNYRIRFAGEAGLAYSEKILTLNFLSPCPELAGTARVGRN